ncbi:hypothetical protein BH09BAC6_BH09BAC6_32970 [soil metagenome]|jgi:hypothetical protein
MEKVLEITPYVIGAVSAVISILSILFAFLRVKNSSKITLAKKDKSNITVHTDYNRGDSKRLIEYLDGCK